MGRVGAREAAAVRPGAALCVGPGRRGQVVVKTLRRSGGAAALEEAGNPQHPHAAVERNGHHISGSYRPPGRVDALAVDAHAARCRKAGGIRAGAHDPGVPQPLVDALAIAVAACVRPTDPVRFSAVPWHWLRAAP